MKYLKSMVVLLLSMLIFTVSVPVLFADSKDELSKALEVLVKTVDDTNAKLLTLNKESDKLEGQIEKLEQFNRRLLLDGSRVGASQAVFLPTPPSGKVTVQLVAKVVNDAFPGEFKFYLAAPEAARVFKTESIPRNQPVPKGGELKNGIAFVEPGKFYTLQVVYENPSDEEVHFLVGAPTLDPQAALPFARARCWCAAIPFSAPKRGTFYRTIQVGVAPNTPPGAKAMVVWPVISLDQSS